MNLYHSGKYQMAWTTSYPNKSVVKNRDDFVEVVREYDYCFAEFKDGKTQAGQFVKSHRSGKDWIESNCLYADVDDGYEISQFMVDFNKYEYYLTTSKSHQIFKNGKTVDRFHVVFPIHTVDNMNQHKEYLKILHKYFFNMDKLDKACIDSSRFFYANKNTKCFYNDGKSIGNIIHKIWESNPEPKPRPVPKIGSTYNKMIISKIKTAYEHGWFDEYSEWIQLGIAMKASGFELEHWMEFCHTEKDKTDANYKWQGFSEAGSININYLLDICKRVQKYYK